MDERVLSKDKVKYMKSKFSYKTNWNSYLPFLYEALEKTKSGTVLEYGMGDGSTPILHDYCKAKKRKLKSFDYDKQWAEKFANLASADHKIYVVKDWDEAYDPDATVVFIDQSPGERRKIDIQKYATSNAIVVVHDTEPAADHGYQMRQYFGLYKYVKDYQTNGAWATVLSNHYNITTFNT